MALKPDEMPSVTMTLASYFQQTRLLEQEEQSILSGQNAGMGKPCTKIWVQRPAAVIMSRSVVL